MRKLKSTDKPRARFITPGQLDAIDFLNAEIINLIKQNNNFYSKLVSMSTLPSITAFVLSSRLPFIGELYDELIAICSLSFEQIKNNYFERVGIELERGLNLQDLLNKLYSRGLCNNFNIEECFDGLDRKAQGHDIMAQHARVIKKAFFSNVTKFLNKKDLTEPFDYSKPTYEYYIKAVESYLKTGLTQN